MQVAARRLLRTMLGGGVLIVVAVALAETWLLDGLVTPYRVRGGSMAGTLLGVHRDVVCADCGYRFACDSNVRSPPVRAVCPNCGYAGNDVQSYPDAAGDRVLVDRTAFTVRGPRRWEVVALRAVAPDDGLAVKRVVGLPGESIEIRQGDVYVDGEIVRKNLAEQRALAVMVYDARFVSAREPQAPARWRPEQADSGSRADQRVFRHAADPEHRGTDWLVYHHPRRLPVTDLCGYNQSQPRREEDVHAVTDLLLSLRVRCVAGRGELAIRLGDGSRGFEARLRFVEGRLAQWTVAGLQPAPGVLITRCTDNEPAAHGDGPAARSERLVEVSSVDRQFLLAVDGRTVAAISYQRFEPPAPPTCPTAIGANGIDVTVRDLRLYRDVYYTDRVKGDSPIFADHRSAAAPAKIGTVPAVVRGGGRRPGRTLLGPEEYYVLGDNSPVSDDSRTWPGRGAVDAKLLLGKPLVAIPAAVFSPWGTAHFQVPNLRAIRYIR